MTTLFIKSVILKVITIRVWDLGDRVGLQSRIFLREVNFLFKKKGSRELIIYGIIYDEEADLCQSLNMLDFGLPILQVVNLSFHCCKAPSLCCFSITSWTDKGALDRHWAASLQACASTLSTSSIALILTVFYVLTCSRWDPSRPRHPYFKQLTDI